MDIRLDPRDREARVDPNHNLLIRHFEALLSPDAVIKAKTTLPEQDLLMAQEEIDKQRREGKADGAIWFDALQAGNADIIQQLIRQPPAGFDINIRDADGQSALRIAVDVKTNRDRIVTLLLDSGIDVNLTDDDGDTALHEAVLDNSPDVIRHFVEAGADLFARDGEGRTPFQKAEHFGKPYKSGPRLTSDAPGIPEAKENAGVLKEVATQRLTSRLAEAQADPAEIKDLVRQAGADKSPLADHLHRFIAIRDAELVQLALDAGADLTVKNEQGQAAFSAALDQRLKADQADVETLDAITAVLSVLYGATLVQFEEALLNDHEKAVKLIEADSVAVAPMGSTTEDPALTYLAQAAALGAADVVEALLARIPQEQQSDFINRKGPGGQTALHAAAAGGHVEIYEMLRDAGGDASLKQDDGATPPQLLYDGETLPPQTSIYGQHITDVHYDAHVPAAEGLVVSIKGHPMVGDGTYLVLRDTNSQAFSVASDWYTKGVNDKGEVVEEDGDKPTAGGQGEASNEAFLEAFGLKQEDWDIFTQPTSEKADKDSDKTHLTVGELAMKLMFKDYQEAAKSDPHGKKAEFIAQLEALSAYRNGRQVIAYSESIFGRNLEGTPTVPSESWASFLDVGAIEKRSQELWQDEEISADYAGYVSQALDKAEGPSRQERLEKLRETLVSAEFTEAIGKLKKEKRDAEAEAIVSTGFSSLAILAGDDTQIIDDTAATLQKNAITFQLNDIIQEGEFSPEAENLALKDVINLVITSLRSITSSSRRFPAIYALFNEMNGKVSEKKLASTIEKIVLATRNSDSSEISEEQIRRIASETYTDKSEQGRVISALNEFNASGLFGSISAAFTLLAGFYMLLQPTTGDWKERILEVRTFLGFLSFGEVFIRLLAPTIDDWFLREVKDAQGNIVKEQRGVVALLGLDITLPEIYGKDGSWGKDYQAPTTYTDVETSLAKSIGIEVDKLDAERFKQGEQAFIDNLSEGERKAYTEELRRLNDTRFKVNVPNSDVGGRNWKIAGAAVKSLGVLDIFTGVMDIVFGVFRAKEGAEHRDPLMISSGVVSAVSGITAGVSGGVYVFNNFIRVLSSVTRFTPPLMIASVILGVLSALLETFIGMKQANKVTGEQLRWLQTLDHFGFLKEDWGKVFEYLITWETAKRAAPPEMDQFREPIPPGKSILDVDPARWERFRDTWAPGEDALSAFLTEEEMDDWVVPETGEGPMIIP